MRYTLHSLSLLSLLSILVGCGQPADDAFSPGPMSPDDDMPDAAPDLSSAPDSGAPDLAEAPDLGPPPPPEVLMFTFWRRDNACPVNNCVTSFRLGLRAGTFERLRGDLGLGAITLEQDEIGRARELINTELVRRTMKADSGWGCPEAAPDSDPTYGFEAALFEGGREKRWFQSVTGCVQSPALEDADGIIDLVRELQQRYYP